MYGFISKYSASCVRQQLEELQAIRIWSHTSGVRKKSACTCLERRSCYYGQKQLLWLRSCASRFAFPWN